MMVAQLDRSYIINRPTKAISRLLSYAFFEGRPITVRGRWINPVVFSLFDIVSKLPQLKKVRSPIFIVGTGRSGTTILGLVLSMHKDLSFLNEPKALWHAIHPQEDLIGSYSSSDSASSYRLAEQDATPARVEKAHRIFGAYLLTTFSRTVVDKYPEHIFRIPFVKHIFPDARFIFLVRNGFDTCQSIDLWSRRLGEEVNGEVHDWWGIDRKKWKLLVSQLVPEHDDLSRYQQQMMHWTDYRNMAAVEWIVTMREGLRIQKQYPDSLIRVDYEKLCEDPYTLLSDLTEKLGLRRDSKFLDYGVKTLEAVPTRAGFRLHRVIQEPFKRTMRDLCYDV